MTHPTDTAMADAFASAGIDTGSLDAPMIEVSDLFGQSDDGHEPEHAASATAMACEAAALHGATPGPDEFDNRPLWEAPDRIKTRSLGPLTFAERRTRRKEYKVRSDQDPNLHPGDPLDLPDLRAGFEDSHLPGIVREIVDLAAERLCADGTMLADERESLIWGLVNCFHAQTQRLDRALDRMEPELRDLQRAQDGTEVKARELEIADRPAHNTADRRDALEIFRDCAADAYRARTGEPLAAAPRFAHQPDRQLTSAAIDARDFMRARKDRETMAHLPQGTLVAIAGGKDIADPAAVIARLDKAREKYADMVLVHGGGPGVEKIAARWAERNGIQQIVCKPDWNRHGRAAPVPPQRRLAQPSAEGRDRLPRLRHHRQPCRQGAAAWHPGSARRRLTAAQERAAPSSRTRGGGAARCAFASRAADRRCVPCFAPRAPAPCRARVHRPPRRPPPLNRRCGSDPPGLAGVDLPIPRAARIRLPTGPGRPRGSHPTQRAARGRMRARILPFVCLSATLGDFRRQGLVGPSVCSGAYGPISLKLLEIHFFVCSEHTARFSGEPPGLPPRFSREPSNSAQSSLENRARGPEILTLLPPAPSRPGARPGLRQAGRVGRRGPRPCDAGSRRCGRCAVSRRSHAPTGTKLNDFRRRKPRDTKPAAQFRSGRRACRFPQTA